MKKVKCTRCGAVMQFDGDAWHCNECSMIAVDMGDGEPYFCDDELDYDGVGFTVHCPECGTIMVMTEDGCECPQCGTFLAEGEYNDELDD